MEVYSDKIKLTSNSGVVLEHTAFFSVFYIPTLYFGWWWWWWWQYSVSLFLFIYKKMCRILLDFYPKKCIFSSNKKSLPFLRSFFLLMDSKARALSKNCSMFFCWLVKRCVCVFVRVWRTTTTSILLNVKKKILPYTSFYSRE